ncbi:HD domain-containing protein [Micromonospora sp. NPDC050686]|uniref:HD domain-containing protein n=1 Tax=Micromonospora sp. NPDC050686 TaxID=3154631 RepID=UPI0033D9E43B
MTIQHASVIPTDEQIRALHERYAPTEEAFDLVYTHCRIVCDVAEQLLDRHRPAVDVELVRAGSLLHDIGVYRLYDATGRLDHENYLRHGVLGQALLRDLGFPELVSRFCAHHTGVGLTRDDVLRQGLALPVGDYTADTVEEQLVMYADKFHSKTTPPAFVSAASYAAGVRRFGADKVVRFAELVERFGEPDLLALSRRHQHPVR